MLLGIPYDSDKGRSIAGALTAILCGHAFVASAEIAAAKGAFAGYAKNREPMLRVMRMHQEAAYALNRDQCPDSLWRAATEDWDNVVRLGEQHGYRNAQATVLAPTGTIGLLMDCDTTGIEPDFALVKFKKLAGGGYFKIVNQSVPEALKRLRYSEAQIQEIVAYVSGTNTLARRAAREPRLAQGTWPDGRRADQGRSRPARRVRPEPGVRALGRRSRNLRSPGRHGRSHQPARLQPAQVPRLQRQGDRGSERRRSSVA